MEEELDYTKLRYVLYARKSTTDETRQVRSIDDQMHDCQQLAKRLGLRVVAILREEKSAKKPNQRPIFRQMLKDLKDKKYDGILAWNPDRLARNMLEGGTIIHMIDENQITDLKFVTHYFTKDANGKMLLGMAFVLSKQYSDDLSQKVTRGVRRSFDEGKSPAPKHGYIRDEEGFYRPDGKSFDLICEAWQMRREGTSLEKIAQYMNDNNYERIVKSSGAKIRMTADILSTQVFTNPFYFGILISEKTDKQVDLREQYDFVPATDEETYRIVQNLYRNRSKPYNRRRSTFYPLKMMILCGYCNKPMYSAPSRSAHSGVYLNYRCDNEDCIRIDPAKKIKKTTRVITILKFIYQLLEERLHFSEEDYRKYYEDMLAIADQQRELLLNQRNSKQTILSYISREIRDRSLQVGKHDPNSRIAKENYAYIEKLEQEEDDTTQELSAIKEQLGNPAEEALTIEGFLNLAKNAAKAVKMGDAIVKDKICRLIFLNLVVDEEKVLSFQAKPPFDKMLKMPSPASGRGAGN
jgi:DNA invertase Pin-like site-specific DNA recombinase